MTDKDYEYKKRECWEEFCESDKLYDVEPAFNYAFDRAYALGKQEKDAEGEKMLTVEADLVKELYQRAKEIEEESKRIHSPLVAAKYRGVQRAIEDLFGSKCLPDEKPTTQFKIGDKVRAKGTKQIGTIKEPHSNDIGYRVYFEDGDGGWDKEYQEDELIPYKEPKPTEPKFKGGDLALYLKKSIVRIIEYHPEQQKYYVHRSLDNLKFSAGESDLEPYTEPDTSHETPVFENHSNNTSQKEVNVNSNRNLSKDCDKQLDNILKDGFRNERRLNIATQIMSAILSNQKMLNNLAHGETTVEGVVKCIVDTTMMYTDALIAECEKGGKS